MSVRTSSPLLKVSLAVTTMLAVAGTSMSAEAAFGRRRAMPSIEVHLEVLDSLRQEAAAPRYAQQPQAPVQQQQPQAYPQAQPPAAIPFGQPSQPLPQPVQQQQPVMQAQQQPVPQPAPIPAPVPLPAPVQMQQPVIAEAPQTVNGQEVAQFQPSGEPTVAPSGQQVVPIATPEYVAPQPVVPVEEARNFATYQPSGMADEPVAELHPPRLADAPKRRPEANPVIAPVPASKSEEKKETKVAAAPKPQKREPAPEVEKKPVVKAEPEQKIAALPEPVMAEPEATEMPQLPQFEELPAIEEAPQEDELMPLVALPEPEPVAQPEPEQVEEVAALPELPPMEMPEEEPESASILAELPSAPAPAAPELPALDELPPPPVAVLQEMPDDNADEELAAIVAVPSALPEPVTEPESIAEPPALEPLPALSDSASQEEETSPVLAAATEMPVADTAPKAEEKGMFSELTGKVAAFFSDSKPAEEAALIESPSAAEDEEADLPLPTLPAGAMPMAPKEVDALPAPPPAPIAEETTADSEAEMASLPVLPALPVEEVEEVPVATTPNRALPSLKAIVSEDRREELEEAEAARQAAEEKARMAEEKARAEAKEAEQAAADAKKAAEEQAAKLAEAASDSLKALPPLPLPTAKGEPELPQEMQLASLPEPMEEPPVAAPASPKSAPSTATVSGSGAASKEARLIYGRDDMEVQPSMHAALDEMVGVLKKNADARLKIEAYAGTSEDDEGISRRASLSRALAVRTYLLEAGIDTERVNVMSLGNQSGSGPAERVDITLQ